MGSGDLAVDAMAIGCLGVEHHVERFFSYLAILLSVQPKIGVGPHRDPHVSSIAAQATYTEALLSGLLLPVVFGSSIFLFFM